MDSIFGSSGLVAIKIHNNNPKHNKIKSIIVENATYMVIVNVNTIDIIAWILAFKFIALYFFQLVRNFQNLLWFNNQVSNFFDDLENNQSDNIKGKVVGMPGINMPMLPTDTSVSPKIIYKYFFKFIV